MDLEKLYTFDVIAVSRTGFLSLAHLRILPKLLLLFFPYERKFDKDRELQRGNVEEFVFGLSIWEFWEKEKSVCA